MPDFRRLARITLLPVLVGLAGALLAQAFVGAVDAFGDWLRLTPDSRSSVDAGTLVALTLSVPALAGLVVGLLRRFAAPGTHEGPAEVIEAVQTRRGGMRGWSGLKSGLASLVSLGGGASAGEYGPMVHLGGSAGAGMARWFGEDVTTANNAMACGVAAAISTVFNAPLAGILFAHEIVLRHFSPRAFAPVAVASIMGYVVSNHRTLREPLLQVDGVPPPALWEFLPFLVLGALAAVVSIAYMTAILRAGRLARRMPMPAVLVPAAAGLALGALALLVPDVLGIGVEALKRTLNEPALSWGTGALLVAKIAGTALCLGFGFAGGAFSPALLIGSLFGLVFGGLLELLGLPVSSLTTYAICGMMAVAAPVIGAPVTAVVLTMEMTASYPMTLAALAAVALSNLVAARRFGRSLFDRQLRERHLDLSAGRTKAVLDTRTVRPLVSEHYIAAGENASVDEILPRMLAQGLVQAFLVDGEGRYRGSVRLRDAVSGRGDQKAIELRDRDAVVVRADFSVWRTMQRMKRFVGESVAVVDEEGRLAGALYETDLIQSYLAIEEELRAEEQIASR